MDHTSDFPSLVRSDEQVGRGAAPPVDVTIVMCFDRQFEFFARVALTSLLLNTASRRFGITVITRGLAPENVQSLDVLGKKFGASIRVISVEYGILASLQTRKLWSSATYVRWLAPYLLAQPIILYLDADLLVQADIESLLTLYRSDKTIGGVEDRKGAQFRRESLKLEADDLYLNTGVLLINAERWRAADITHKAIEFALNFDGPLLGVDQDALNGVLLQEKYSVSDQWNVQTFTVGYYGLEKKYSISAFEGIFHFSGEVKPWMRWAGHWSREFYSKYAALVTPSESFWIEPRNVKEKLLYARAADEEGNIARANTARRELLMLLLKSANPAVLERSLT